MQIVTSLLFIVVFLLGFFSLGKHSTGDVQPSSFLPADTLIYLEQKNGAQDINRFQNSKLGKALSSINFVKVIEDTDADIIQPALLETVLSNISQVKGDRLFQELLGKQCAIALFGQRDWSKDDDEAVGFLKNHLLFISKPQANIETLNALINSYTGDVVISDVPYGKYMIRRYRFKNDEVVSVANVDRYVIGSFEERVLRESLDIFDKKTNPLRRAYAFNSMTRELEGADRLLYFSIEGLQALAAYSAEHATTQQSQAILTELSSFHGVETFVYASWKSKKLIKNRIQVRLNQKAMDLRVREMIETSPSINGTLPFVSRDALFYYWSNTLNIRLLWKMYIIEAGISDNDIQAIQVNVKGFAGYTLDEIMNMVSGNVSILINENTRDQFVPIPDTALLLKLEDPERFGQVVQHSLQNLDIKVQNRTYKNINYYYWGIYPKESLQPVYTIYRGYLIVANTLDILKSIVDTPITNRRLLAAKNFRELDPGFQTLNNSVCYIDQARLLSHIGEFISWAGTMLAIQDRQAAEKSKILIDSFINPLFSGLGMYEKSATRTYLRGNQIVIESRTRITE